MWVCVVGVGGVLFNMGLMCVMFGCVGVSNTDSVVVICRLCVVVAILCVFVVFVVVLV